MAVSAAEAWQRVYDLEFGISLCASSLAYVVVISLLNYRCV